eukprot:Pompholyxophrys_sp_v1_NODE_2_length_20472_cov_5.132586.p11 type:complete len:244 gc:universal NODE_2_length_20472_cov_5.132586:14041-14772(+)
MEEKTDLCLLCLEPIRVPVEFTCFPCSSNKNMRNCNSVNRVCLHCARTYLQLNKPKKNRPSSVKCLFCDSTANPQTLNAETSYKKDYRMMVTDDKSDYTCVHDKMCPFTGTQTELERHLQTSCMYRVCFCNDCHVRYHAHQNHERVCKARKMCFCCRKRVLHYELSEHFEKEHSLVKCDYCCRYYKSSLLVDHQKECGCRPITCSICHDDVHHHHIHYHLEGHILYFQTQLDKAMSEKNKFMV